MGRVPPGLTGNSEKSLSFLFVAASLAAANRRVHMSSLRDLQQALLPALIFDGVGFGWQQPIKSCRSDGVVEASRTRRKCHGLPSGDR